MAAFINDRGFVGFLRECFGFLIAVINMAFRAETEQRGGANLLSAFFNDGEMAF